MSSKVHPSIEEFNKQNLYKNSSTDVDERDIYIYAPQPVSNMSKRKHATKRIRITRKQAIPTALKSAIWLAYNGKCFEAKCNVTWCQTFINVFNFEAGHDVPESKGGPTTLENLRPICALCNRSMGNTYSITEFSRKFHCKKTSQKTLYSFLTRAFTCWTQPRP